MRVTMVMMVTMVTMLAGCPKPPPPEPPARGDWCLVAAQATAEDVCDGTFTADGLACVRCVNVAGCVDRTTVVYCSNGPCISDPLCSSQGASQRAR
jgi:hypothetical protein